MKKNYPKLYVFCLLILFFTSAFAQSQKTNWTKISKHRLSNLEKMIRKSEPKKADFYQLDLESLKVSLASAPDRKVASESDVIIDFPLSDGTIESFKIFKASVMDEELQSKYPNIQSYSGTSIVDAGNTIRFSVTPQGLHLMMFSIKKGTQFIDPYTKEGNNYIVYGRKDLPVLDTSWRCDFVDDEVTMSNKSLSNSYLMRDTGDGMMRDFRLAVATTIEYSQFHWEAAGLTGADTVAARRAAVMAAIVVTITRNNFVYERDFSITMTLIGNNDNIVFITSDNFDNNNAGTLINQSQTEIDANIGSANYDVGHTFSTGGGGLAQLNSPCTASKARGITGSAAPVGDPYDIDYVAHELGHQFGAPHTFNGNQGNCAGGNRTASNAYEPGSGTTIMAYAGICGTDNVQSNSDAYFHQKSLQMIWDNVTIGNSTCGAQTATGNAAPTAEAGSNYIIPMSTPYMLTGSSTDADGTTSHTYTWEQYDLGPSGVPADNTATGPLVRSFEGTTNPTRYVPRIQDIVNNGGVSTTWEKLSSVDRDINFRLTVRDNANNGGRTAVDNMTVDVETTAGPFTVTSQNTATTWSQGNLETITWNVAGTNAGTVNTPNVDILLSTDGGMTYPTVLASAVPNDGSHDITVPNVTADDCRVMVKGNGNIFFNINTSRIGIGFNFVAGDVCTDYNFPTNITLTPNATAFEFLSAANVPDSGAITDLNFKLNFTAPDLSNLHFVLQDPGAAVSSYPFNGACPTGNAGMDVTWDDEAGSAIVCGSPATGSATPRAGQELTVFDGVEMNGNWTVFGANTGATTTILNSIDLRICKAGFVATASPNRINQSVVELVPSATEIVANTHLEVTSPNTANATDIVFTLTVLPTNGTLHLNAGPALIVGNTFTQDDINNSRITYTNTSGVNGTDFFRVDTNDSNGGTLPNLRTDITIDSALSVDNFNFNLFDIYPNPANDTFNLILSTKEDVNVSLFDIRGRKIFTNAFKNSSDVFEKAINVSDVSSGIYLLNVETGGKSATKKLIIN
ncbi:reprolysin-like metallopeptidase [Pseudofulvibacter geojedonensis]|uniref:Reprolysin-like metallopeptidase n=1 Tax=Pseudofulvibacter geojedonensis TaxID=1123758 RepID=A0ABW3I1A4_9FLAO